MRPKIEAAIGFVNETGRPASIGRLSDVAAILAGAVGTTVRIDAPQTPAIRSAR
jgi:carbamate kinase